MAVITQLVQENRYAKPFRPHTLEPIDKSKFLSAAKRIPTDTSVVIGNRIGRVKVL